MIDLNTILNELNEEDEQKTPPAICYYPGGFKPPHEGHFEVVKDLASRPYVTKVIVLIGHKTRDGITKEQSKRIWDLYLATSPMAKVTVRISTDASPIKDIFTAFDDDLELKAYVAGAKNEVEEQDYFTPLQKAFSTRVMPLSIEEKVITGDKRLSGTETRGLVTQLKKDVLALRAVTDKNSTEYSKARNNYLNTYKALEGCFPEAVVQKGGFEDILKILGIPVLNVDQLQENQADGNLIIRVPYALTQRIENYLNTMLVPFEYSQQAFGGKERRMLIPNLGDSPDQRDQVLKYLSKHNIPVNVEEDLFTINWWKSTLEETLTAPEETTDNTIADFIDFAAKALDLQQVPKINFTDNQNVAKQMHSLGAYQPKNDELLVVRGPRLTADVLRTLAHELVHRKQAEMRPLKPEDGKTGSEIENEANAAAGILLRQFGKYRPEIFQEADRSKGDYKIYCDMDGVLVDFDKGYFDLTGEKASFDTDPNKFWEPISKAGAAFWIKLKWMPDGKQLWDFIKPYNPDLLSAPSREESSRLGKRVWVKRELPGTKLILRSADRKQEFATPNSILIDDRADNIQRWKAAGGIGILHTSAADTIQQLKDIFGDKEPLQEIGDASSPALPWTTKVPIDVVAKMFIEQIKKAEDPYQWVSFNSIFEYEAKSDKATYEIGIQAIGRKKRSFVLSFGNKPAPKPKTEYEMEAYVGFSVNGTEDDTNLNEQYRVMATMVECTQDFVKRVSKYFNIDKIVLLPKADSDNSAPKLDSKRGRLYLAYVQKNLNKLPGKWTAYARKDGIEIRSGDWKGGDVVAKN